jgi:heme-degrading monooxygenase HmoA
MMIAIGGTTLIARLWRGWATVENARAYEELFRAHILPGLHAIDGFAGAHVLRRDGEHAAEITTITFFASMEAVRAFAGDDPTMAHVTPEARRLLTRFEETVTHYDVALSA